VSILKYNDEVCGSNSYWRLTETPGPIAAPELGGQTVTEVSECITGLTLGGKYKIVGEVGRGRSAVVYKAVDVTSERPVAVKLLQRQTNVQGSPLLRLQREAETASALNHPNITKVYDFGISDDLVPYVVMDYVTGMLLGTRVRVLSRIPLREALPILIQICDGMAYAHDHDVIHRDLRPDNIFLVARDGQPELVQIVDFGVAKKLHDSKKKLTSPGEMLGTPEYMSPEQILGSSELDARSDIYSMGCLMFYVLSGHLPFTGSKIDVLKGQVSSEPRDFSDPSCGRHLPPEVQMIVKRALNKYPADRQQSMHELRDQLKAFVIS
jgi:serine/threonine-protein kinase